MDAPQRPILVVEDSEEDFDTIQEAARRSGVRNRLVWATDADIARSLLPPGGGDAYAFMLLDSNLPGTDGRTFLQELRQDPDYRRLPAVVFTTSVNPRDCDAFYEAGANAYHIKSVRFDECMSTLAGIFQYWLNLAVLPDKIRAGRSGPGHA
jgi:two-component system chemotaxis response regulator CheY